MGQVPARIEFNRGQSKSLVDNNERRESVSLASRNAAADLLLSSYFPLVLVTIVKDYIGMIEGIFEREFLTQALSKPLSKPFHPYYINIFGAKAYVTDSENHCVHVFNALNGQWLTSFGGKGSTAGLFHTPSGIVVNLNRIFICDRTNGRIQAFRADDYSFVIQSTFIFYPLGCALNGKNELFVSDIKNDTILVFDTVNLKLLRELKVGYKLKHLAICGEEVYATCVGAGVKVFDSKDGQLVREWGAQGSGVGEFQYPSGIAVSDDEVYVGDARNNRVQVFRTSGEYLRQWGTAGKDVGKFDGLQGMSVVEGELFVDS